MIILSTVEIVREIFNENSDGLSSDRLRHVRSYTDYITADELDSTDGNEVESDEMIMIGDKVCGKLAEVGKSDRAHFTDFQSKTSRARN